jgi:hypothetical protein
MNVLHVACLSDLDRSSASFVSPPVSPRKDKGHHGRMTSTNNESTLSGSLTAEERKRLQFQYGRENSK